jgi:hypothetical protein
LPAKKTITLKDGSKRYEFTVDEPRVKAADAPLTPERRQTVIAALTDAAEYRRRTDPGQADAYETLARELPTRARPPSGSRSPAVSGRAASATPSWPGSATRSGPASMCGRGTAP